MLSPGTGSWVTSPCHHLLNRPTISVTLSKGINSLFWSTHSLAFFYILVQGSFMLLNHKIQFGCLERQHSIAVKSRLWSQMLKFKSILTSYVMLGKYLPHGVGVRIQ